MGRLLGSAIITGPDPTNYRCALSREALVHAHAGKGRRGGHGGPVAAASWGLQAARVPRWSAAEDGRKAPVRRAGLVEAGGRGRS
jgi:hypothetical protein